VQSHLRLMECNRVEVCRDRTKRERRRRESERIEGGSS
jgi:hypothetical protein